MKKFRNIFLTLLLAVLAAGCTQNNGHIGRIFGSWYLEEATIDGVPMELPVDTETFFSFQSDIVLVTLKGTYGYKENYFGTFEQLSGGLLRLHFTYSDNDNPVGTGAYSAPTWLGFPSEGVFDLQESSESKDDKLVLTRVSDSGEIYIFKFTKTW